MRGVVRDEVDRDLAGQATCGLPDGGGSEGPIGLSKAMIDTSSP